MRYLMLATAVFISSTVAADQRIATKSTDQIPEDPAAAMVAGIDKFLLRKWDEADKWRKDEKPRAEYWQNKKQFAENRTLLKKIIGLEKARYSADDEILYERANILESDSFVARHARWPVLPHPAPQTANAVGLWGEGIHLAPVSRNNETLVVVIPDADELPEHWLPLGMTEYDKLTKWRENFATDLANDGNDVVIMATIDRKIHQHRNAKLSRREYLHRAAFELGRTLTAYEIQTVQALIDHFKPKHVLVVGVGEGGRTALLASAIDDRIDLTAVGSYFGQHGPLWGEPLSRQLFGVHERFDDGFIAALIAPREFYFFDDKHYHVNLPGSGGAPAEWSSSESNDVNFHFAQYKFALTSAGIPFAAEPVDTGRQDLRERLGNTLEVLRRGDHDARVTAITHRESERLKEIAQRRSERYFDAIDSYNQAVLLESPYERRDYINIDHPREDNADKSNHVDTSSPDRYKKSIDRFRDDFRENVIGWFDDKPLALNARSQPRLTGENWTGHDIMLDVFPDVFAYGVLLMPNEIPDGERRPVVVCQHGLEGRPDDTITGDHRAYHDFAAKLASEGYIVFAPQNPYIGRDDFRTLQRKAYPLGKTLFSIIGAQHKQIIRYLKTIPSVDPDRIAFYGLSYGGKSAMRLPALLPEYCLSICSADFNDWVWKNASSRSRYSYIGTGEYEIFEFGLGQKFNYAEMAALIAPRPFMVERGHYDGVAPDSRVAMEFAKVRFLYQARLKLKDQCEIEFFDGPHTINGQGTFEFLRRHLGSPKP